MEEAYNPFISIVIPFFNRENTLSYCIDSVLNQHYDNWELLLIDDGSTDNSANLCKQYSKKDGRINYLYQENQGAGPARNRGIKEAKGDWITFVDSDDAILPEHLNQLQKYGKSKDLVMVSRCKAKYKDGYIRKISKSNDLKNICLEGNKQIVEYLYGDEFNPYQHANFACWDKFFRMSIIREHSIRYPLDVPTGQDQIFVVNYFKYTESFFLSEVGTYVPTPMGDEGIEHLACKLRMPEEFLYCQKKNYEALMELATITKSESVRKYAVNYILDKPFTRIIIPYTKWRNRVQYGKGKILKFIRKDFLPIIQEHKNELDYVKNERYRTNLKLILAGKESKVYDFWFWYRLKKDIKFAIRRRLK